MAATPILIVDQHRKIPDRLMKENAGLLPATPFPRSLPNNTPATNADQSRAATLNSWKEIAAFLNRGVRTVQRWERDLKLPVHRIGQGNRSPVFAFTAEINLWLYTNRTKIEDQPLSQHEFPTPKPALNAAEAKLNAAWLRCRKLTDELRSLTRQHQLQTARLVQNLGRVALHRGRAAQPGWYPRAPISQELFVVPGNMGTPRRPSRFSQGASK